MLRLTDLYQSIQGEGPRVGAPTTFIRFGGCNLRCPGWPCDTQHAIQPEMWRHDPQLTATEILQRLELLVPTENICITGGEPFTQPADDLDYLAEQLFYRHHTIDVFTNGTRSLPDWIYERNVVVIMDWKLQGSGEGKKAIAVRELNLEKLRRKDWVKLVINSDEDFDEAIEVWKRYKDSCWNNWCVGVAWGLSEKLLTEWVLENGLPWHVNVQIHKFIFDPMEAQI